MRDNIEYRAKKACPMYVSFSWLLSQSLLGANCPILPDRLGKRRFKKHERNVEHPIIDVQEFLRCIISFKDGSVFPTTGNRS